MGMRLRMMMVLLLFYFCFNNFILLADAKNKPTFLSDSDPTQFTMDFTNKNHLEKLFDIGSTCY
jgi:hypothetical protein